MANYKTFRKEKWLYFFLSIVTYFVPFVVTAGVFLPMIKAATGFKIAMGLAVVIINAIPFLMGLFKSFFAHFPMLNILSIVFLILAVFFTMDAFQNYVEIFCWIELAAAVGSVASCVLWGQYLKYAESFRTVKANIKSGAFVMKEDKDD